MMLAKDILVFYTIFNKIKKTFLISVARFVDVDRCEHHPNNDVSSSPQQLRPDATTRRLSLSSARNDLQCDFGSNVEPLKQLLRLLRLSLLSNSEPPSQPKLRLSSRTFSGDGHVSSFNRKRFNSSKPSPFSISVFRSEISDVSSQSNEIPVDQSPQQQQRRREKTETRPGPTERFKEQSPEEGDDGLRIADDGEQLGSSGDNEQLQQPKSQQQQQLKQQSE